MTHTQGVAEKRLRGGTKKSRTGCRTCRIIPRKDKGQLQSLPLEITDGFRWAVTTDERRCYSYFQHYTVPTLSDSFDSRLWQEVLCHMSQSDPAVYHAVIALSAVHQDSETHGMPLPGQDLKNEWHLFALEQCGRSFALLSRRQSSQDPRFREVMLICCLLFVMIQLLRGQYDDAFLHLQSGLKVLNEAMVSDSSERPIAPCIVAAFANLEAQAVQYGACKDFSANKGVAYPAGYMDNLTAFNNLSEARQAFDFLTSTAFRFVFLCKDLSEEEILTDYDFFQSQQLQVLSQFGIFGHRFEPFCSCSTLPPDERRGADVLRIQLRSLGLQIRLALVRDETVLDCYNSEYEAHVNMIVGLLSKYPVVRPTVVLEAGIISPLYFAALWCRDYSVRHRAIDILLSWPHREGAFDANWAALQALQRMSVELSIEPELVAAADIPCLMSDQNGDRWVPINCNGIAFEDALSYAKVMLDRPCFQTVRKWVPAVVYDSP
ncbi:uncharacterized protein DSM5745_09594 [Aspergillus mulundensis]|uniref:C6 zinc finger domain protein n=1 Tax=Aspergillus mulundensis TaxID=1810919 RepID=A0A3D8QVQ4_9EURO|nr:Uncharacterized protein DSM5745_09594 [Aspergillus mulundensis]RDW65855.1 Uncharacterized protein DSM5745_09594 [Aspergillus mulundensis]